MSVGTTANLDDWAWRVMQDLAYASHVYRTRLDTCRQAHDSHYDFPLTEGALGVFNILEPKMRNVKRWERFKPKETGDMNVATHSLKQSLIGGEALIPDATPQSVSIGEVDAVIAAGLLHDVGEIVHLDTPYHEKRKIRELAEKRERDATFQFLDKYVSSERMRSGLKETYQRITTSLLWLEDSRLPPYEWDTLRELFDIYEQYGYVMTAVQKYPFNNGEPEIMLNDPRLYAWDANGIQSALKEGQDVPEYVRGYILFKAVASDHWDVVIDANKNLPSAKQFFGNGYVKPIIYHARDRMGMQIDTSLFNQ